MTTTRTVLKRVLGTAGVLALTALTASNLWVLASAHGSTETDLAKVVVHDVAIVPGSRASRSGKPLAALAARLEAATALYRTGRARKILISGIETASDPEVSAMTAWLDGQGVPRTDVLVDDGGARTRATMSNAAIRFNVRSAVICTQSLHMPRSLFLAHAAGISAEGIALPTPLSSSPKWVGREVLKNALAFLETYGPTQARQLTVALR